MARVRQGLCCRGGHEGVHEALRLPDGEFADSEEEAHFVQAVV